MYYSRQFNTQLLVVVSTILLLVAYAASSLSSSASASLSFRRKRTPDQVRILADLARNQDMEPALCFSDDIVNGLFEDLNSPLRGPELYAMMAWAHPSLLWHYGTFAATTSNAVVLRYLSTRWAQGDRDALTRVTNFSVQTWLLATARCASLINVNIERTPSTARAPTVYGGPNNTTLPELSACYVATVPLNTSDISADHQDPFPFMGEINYYHWPTLEVGNLLLGRAANASLTSFCEDVARICPARNQTCYNFAFNQRVCDFDGVFRTVGNSVFCRQYHFYQRYRSGASASSVCDVFDDARTPCTDSN